MMKKNIFVLITLTTIILLGGFLRFYNITKNPPALNGDEISFGYIAYSILKTGHDEHGKFLPLVFQSIGDYKNPVPGYLMIPSIKIFGLNDFAVRLPNALMGTLSILIFFLFLKSIFKNIKVALVGSFFLSISAWHIFYSRFAYEGVTASLFILLGIWFFIKMLDGNWKWAILSAFFLILTMYTSFAPRLFVPIFIAIVLLINFPKLKTNWKKVIIFLITCLIFIIPLIYVTFFQGGNTRLQMVFIGNDIEFSRYILLKYFNSIQDLPLLFFFWIKRYLSYLQPNLLFFNGLEATIMTPIGLGMMYFFEIPFLILGIIYFIKKKVPHKEIFIVWLLTGFLPDSLTNNQQHTGRLLHLFPVFLTLTSLGAIEFYKLINNIKNKYIKISILGSYIFLITIVLIHAYLIISINFPRDKGESFEEGLREVALYVKDNQDKYKEIVIDIYSFLFKIRSRNLPKGSKNS